MSHQIQFRTKQDKNGNKYREVIVVSVIAEKRYHVSKSLPLQGRKRRGKKTMR